MLSRTVSFSISDTAPYFNDRPPERTLVSNSSEDAQSSARGASLAAFGGRCIPAGGVAPPSNIPDILGRRALPPGRLPRLGATPDLHHGLLGEPLGDFLRRSAASRPNCNYWCPSCWEAI